jgi:hypothetical protein
MPTEFAEEHGNKKEPTKHAKKRERKKINYEGHGEKIQKKNKQNN